jgi:myosin heavy subunit
VLKRWRQEKETAAKTEEINEVLREELKELAKQLPEDADVSAKELRELAEKLGTTSDLREAMRQYAELERRMQQAAQRMDQRETEELLRQAGEALANDPAHRDLARMLQQKDFQQAAERLKSLTPSESTDPAAAAQQMEKLKSAAQRMGHTAKEFAQRNGEKKASDPSSVVSQMQALDEAVRKLDQAMRNGSQSQQQQQSQQQKQQQQQQCKQCQSQCQSCANQLSQSMQKCGQCRSMAQQMKSLCNSLSQCSNYLNGQGQCPGGNKSGGKQAGKGTEQTRRTIMDPTVTPSTDLQIKGQMGQGPSDKTTEDADSGDTVASGVGASRERSYTRQAESFVRREDVPAEVRQGVKTYFETLEKKP